MTYNNLVLMAGDGALLQRIGAAAADQHIDDPVGWAQRHSWDMITQPGWSDAYGYAEDTKTVNVNPDTGARDDVISDGMILSAVQAVHATDGP